MDKILREEELTPSELAQLTPLEWRCKVCGITCAQVFGMNIMELHELAIAHWPPLEPYRLKLCAKHCGERNG